MFPMGLNLFLLAVVIPCHDTKRGELILGSSWAPEKPVEGWQGSGQPGQAVPSWGWHSRDSPVLSKCRTREGLGRAFVLCVGQEIWTSSVSSDVAVEMATTLRELH